MVILDPFLMNFALVSFIALFVGLIFHQLKQPPLVVYIITGVIIGPFFLGLVDDIELVSHIGSLGIVLLLFFLGMEVSVERIAKNWKIAILGTLFQVVISIFAVYILGSFYAWSLPKVILFGFIISLSSTAVILKIVETRGLLERRVGTDIISVLLMQDLAVAPMILTLSFFGSSVSYRDVLLQVFGIILIVIFLIYIFRKKILSLPFKNNLLIDREFQLLVAFLLCFGFAFLTGIFQLSTALGAFIGGIFVSKIKETHWVHESLHSFKILFLAIFFLSIGLILDVTFMLDNLLMILLLVFVILVLNTIVNTFIFWTLGVPLKYGVFSGAVLAQIGEFSFLLAAIGLQGGIIFEAGYQTVISVISISLLISPIWIDLFYRFSPFYGSKK